MASPSRGVRGPEPARPAPGIGGRRSGAGDAMACLRSISSAVPSGWSFDMLPSRERRFKKVKGARKDSSGLLLSPGFAPGSLSLAGVTAKRILSCSRFYKSA